MLSEHLRIYFTCSDLWWPKMVVHLMWPIYGHMTQISFSYIFECFLCKMAKNCKKIFTHPKIESFLRTLWRPLWPPLGGVSWGGRWLSYGMLLKVQSAFYAFYWWPCFIGWFKVYFKQSIGSWSQKCNPHFVQFGPLFIVQFRPNLFYGVQ